MFRLLGSSLCTVWMALAVVAAWILALILCVTFGADWKHVTVSGDVAFLPHDSPSVQADRVYQSAFPLQYSGSNIAIVLSRADHPLDESDRSFVREHLRPALGTLAASYASDRDSGPVASVHTPDDRGVGKLLVSSDEMAMLVVVELKTKFRESVNDDVVGGVEKALADLKQKAPPGLDVAITGSATAGRDLDFAEAATARDIEFWTIGIVIALLLIIYRAPLVALIPLVSVFVSVSIAIPILSTMAQWGWIAPARDLRVFITVLAYGAGVDYCLFLIARFREELDGGLEPAEAIRRTLVGVGGAITASALTVICGIAVLACAGFQKIHQAGLVIPLALLVPLFATLTFSAALLRLAGKSAFWPRPAASAEHHSGWWEWVGQRLIRRPGMIWLAVTAAMTPFALIAIWKYNDTNYNPLGELAADTPAQRGGRILAEHFPAGTLGAVTVLLVDDKIDFSTPAGAAAVAELSRNLRRRDDLEIADIRSIADPIGLSETAKKALSRYKNDEAAKEAMRDEAESYYVSRADETANHVTRLNLTLAVDPLTQRAIGLFGKLKSALPQALPTALSATNVHFAGSTASLSDLSDIKQHDQRLIQVLVPCVVFVLLLILLRRVIVSAYLVASVVFSYLSTLGVTWIVFRFLTGGDFLGLDWKVTIFLFTILVAVGEDYNIFLLTRVHEEEANHDPENAVRVALVRTGRVISSCGFLMAGTFASLLAGSLRAMLELGFALSFGVLLETLVVRPILVPAFLLLMHRWAPDRPHGGGSDSPAKLTERPSLSSSSNQVASDGS